MSLAKSLAKMKKMDTILGREDPETDRLESTMWRQLPFRWREMLEFKEHGKPPSPMDLWTMLQMLQVQFDSVSPNGTGNSVSIKLEQLELESRRIEGLFAVRALSMPLLDYKMPLHADVLAVIVQHVHPIYLTLRRAYKQSPLLPNGVPRSERDAQHFESKTISEGKRLREKYRRGGLKGPTKGADQDCSCLTFMFELVSSVEEYVESCLTALRFSCTGAGEDDAISSVDLFASEASSNATSRSPSPTISRRSPEPTRIAFHEV